MNISLNLINIFYIKQVDRSNFYILFANKEYLYHILEFSLQTSSFIFTNTYYIRLNFKTVFILPINGII